MHKVVYPLVVAVGFVALLLFLVAGSGYHAGRLTLGGTLELMRIASYVGISGTGVSIFYILWQRPRSLMLGLIFLSAICGLATYYLAHLQQWGAT